MEEEFEWPITAISPVGTDGAPRVLVVVVDLSVEVVVTTVVVVELDVVVSFAASPAQPATAKMRIKPSDLASDAGKAPSIVEGNRRTDSGNWPLRRAGVIAIQ